MNKEFETIPDFLREESVGETISKETAQKIGETTIRVDKKARAKEEIDYYAGEIRDLELQFRKQLERSEERGEIHIQKEEFSRWEADYRDLWKKLRKESISANLTSDEEAKAEGKVFLYTEERDLAKTIEAQAGFFYVERERELIKQIREQGGNEEDLKSVREFGKNVDRHLDFKYMAPEEIRAYGDREADDARTIAHNGVIKGLNKLNALAEKYGTERFTPRDFWTNEMPKSQKTEAIQRRMRYDRDVVEEFYAHAFKGEVKRREAKLKREVFGEF